MSGRFHTRIQIWLATISDPALIALHGRVDGVDAAGNLRVANWHSEVTSRGEIFHAAYFRVKPPGQGKNEGGIGLSIDNVDSRITYAVETLTEPPLVTLEMIYAHDPDTVIRGYPSMEMNSADWTVREVTAGIGRPRTSGPLCSITVNPRDYPAGFV